LEDFSLIEALRINPQKHRLISVVGAGGKTTLIFALARELQGREMSVAVTTTTHMASEGRYGIIPMGIPCGDGKIKGISREYPAELLKRYDIVLVEADGSRRLPFKVPAEHEPVLPKETDLVIGVAGAGAIGQPFARSCCRYELACEYLAVGEEDRILPQHLVSALTASWGQKKGVECEYRYVIGQGDLLAREQLEEILRDAQNKKKDRGCILSFKERWYRTETECESVSLTRDLVRIESTNPGKGEGEIEEYICEYLKNTDARIRTDEVLPGRRNVTATICGEEKGPMLVFSCHMDTVVIGKDWTRKPLGGEMEDGRLYGRGACDMKSGLACALAVFKRTALAVKEGRMRLRYPLRLLCSVDEEGYMQGVEHALEQGLVRAEDWVLDMEPTGGEIQMAHKGRLWLEVCVHGITAHASKPEQGADAVAAAAELIHDIRREIGKLLQHPLMGKTTVTFGQIEGGYQPYVVPDECQIWMDVRLAPPTSAEGIFAIVNKAAARVKEEIPGICIEYRVTGDRPYVEINEKSHLLAGLQKAVWSVTGKEQKAGVFPGYTDTAVIAGRLGNKDCMSYGPGDLKYAHKPDEHVDIEDIERCEKVLTELVKEMIQ